MGPNDIGYISVRLLFISYYTEMARNRNRIKEAYSRAALKCLLEYEEPNTSDIKTEMCYNGFCPWSTCEHENGRKHGDSCGHVLSVKSLSDKILRLLNG